MATARSQKFNFAIICHLPRYASRKRDQKWSSWDSNEDSDNSDNSDNGCKWKPNLQFHSTSPKDFDSNIMISQKWPKLHFMSVSSVSKVRLLWKPSWACFSGILQAQAPLYFCFNHSPPFGSFFEPAGSVTKWHRVTLGHHCWHSITFSHHCWHSPWEEKYGRCFQQQLGVLAVQSQVASISICYGSSCLVANAWNGSGWRRVFKTLKRKLCTRKVNARIIKPRVYVPGSVA